MKKIVLLSLVLFVVSCSPRYYERIYKSTFTVDEIVEINEKLLNSRNIAQKKLYEDRLQDGLVKIDKVTVKSIIDSQNVDYDFCIVSEYKSKKGIVECFIYTKSISTIAKLEEGKSQISVLGNFERMYKLLDDIYLKVDITESAVRIIK